MRPANTISAHLADSTATSTWRHVCGRTVCSRQRCATWRMRPTRAQSGSSSTAIWTPIGSRIVSSTQHLACGTIAVRTLCLPAVNSVIDDNRVLTLASTGRIRLLGNMKMLFEIRDLAYASPATVTRAGVLFISDSAQWKNYVQSWIEAWIEGLPFAVEPDLRKEWQAKAEELFEKYTALVLLELALNYKHTVPLINF
eukprot:1910564-Prymnesium_polylepis.1